MGIYDTRRQRLITILDEHSKDGEFADLLGVDPARLSQLKHGHENIGEKTARKIEKKAKKPDGWLDIPPGAKEEPGEYQVEKETLSDDERILIENYRALDPEQRAALKTVGAAFAHSTAKKAGAGQ